MKHQRRVREESRHLPGLFPSDPPDIPSLRRPLLLLRLCWWCRDCILKRQLIRHGKTSSLCTSADPSRCSGPWISFKSLSSDRDLFDLSGQTRMMTSLERSPSEREHVDRTVNSESVNLRLKTVLILNSGLVFLRLYSCCKSLPSSRRAFPSLASRHFSRHPSKDLFRNIKWNPLALLTFI